MKLLKLATLSTCLLTAASQAAQLDIEITNMTRGSFFTPILVAAHPADNSLFTAGEAASANLQAMAEGGDISGLMADLEAANATIQSNPAGGLLAPGASASASINTDGSEANTHLSIVSMLLPSNDGFMGMNALEIPTEPGTYVINVNAYDAGTEANNEIVGGGAPGEAGFPAPGPVADTLGTGGAGIETMAENYVHIHRGALGDDMNEGGSSDLDNTIHRWLNPVIRVVLTVSN